MQEHCYTVRWEIQVHAETEEAAARIVQDKYFKGGHEGMGFDVKLHATNDAFHCIDLLDTECS